MSNIDEREKSFATQFKEVILGQEDAPTKQMTPSSANTGQFTNTAYTNVDHAGLRTTNTPHQPDQGSAKGDSNEEKVTSTGTGGPGSLLGDRLGV